MIGDTRPVLRLLKTLPNLLETHLTKNSPHENLFIRVGQLMQQLFYLPNSLAAQQDFLGQFLRFQHIPFYVRRELGLTALFQSLGYRKTVEKIAKYFNLIFVVTAIDAVQMLTVWQINEQTGSRLPLIPILTVLGAMFIGFIELKSVYEKSEDKEKAKIADAAAALGSALKNRETQGIVAAVLEYMERAGRQSGSPRGPARSEQAPGPEFMPNPDIYDEE